MNSMYFLISPNCNLKCGYCFQLDNTPEKPGAVDYHRQGGVRAGKKVVDAMVEYTRNNGITNVEIFGGEPLLYADQFEYTVNALCDSNPEMTIGVITNGTLITERIMRLFETRPVSILLSLDGDKAAHDAFRGDFDKISRWFPRLVKHGRTSVALQAARIPGLAGNVQFIWDTGFQDVYINLIENDDWYTKEDVRLFEQEYADTVAGMIEGRGNLSCALQLFDSLQESSHRQQCGITRKGLAADWHGLLYPCHRAMEIGTQLAIGDIYRGINEELSRRIRGMLDSKSFGSEDAKKYPLVSFCPIAVYQDQKDFAGRWSARYCEMINIKAKVVSKRYYDLDRMKAERASAPDKALNWDRLAAA